MTSKRTPAALRIKLQPSRLLTAYLVGVHFLCACCLLWAATSAQVFPSGLITSALSITLLSLVWQLYRHRSSKERVTALACRGATWQISQKGEERSHELKSCWVLPWAVGLGFRDGWRREYLILAYDSCDAEGFRRLKQRLRMAPLRG